MGTAPSGGRWMGRLPASVRHAVIEAMIAQTSGSPGPSLHVLSALSASAMALGAGEVRSDAGPPGALAPGDRNQVYAAAAWITVLDGTPSQDRMDRLSQLARALGIERGRADRLLATAAEVARSHGAASSAGDALDALLRRVAIEDGG